MSKQLPYYCMYPADAETDENFRALSLAELGFYWKCLNHAWINGGLPVDLMELSRALLVSFLKTKTYWKRVSRCFVKNSDGTRYVNLRQEKERLKAIDKSIKATNAVLTRYRRSTDDLLRAYGSGVSSSIQDLNALKTSSGDRARQSVIEASGVQPVNGNRSPLEGPVEGPESEAFDELRKRWRKAGSIYHAERLFFQVLESGSKIEEVRAGIIAWAEYWDDAASSGGWRYCKHDLASALADQIWKTPAPTLKSDVLEDWVNEEVNDAEGRC